MQSTSHMKTSSYSFLNLELSEVYLYTTHFVDVLRLQMNKLQYMYPSPEINPSLRRTTKPIFKTILNRRLRRRSNRLRTHNHRRRTRKQSRQPRTTLRGRTPRRRRHPIKLRRKLVPPSLILRQLGMHKQNPRRDIPSFERRRPRRRTLVDWRRRERDVI
jgi:hypothetical protein